jgi:adenylyltransferase/sulfurtransferase
VDLTNLQRQILYRSDSVGAEKVVEARNALRAVNADVSIQTIQKKLQQADLREIVPAVDVVLDCSDNFETRHAVNRACVTHRKPLITGAAIRFDAQLMVFDLRTKDSPCYACLFPEEGEVEDVQCSTMGVLAPLTGIVGAMQAMEAIKLLAKAGEPLAGRLLVIDAAKTEWRSMRIAKDPACAVCAQSR